MPWALGVLALLTAYLWARLHAAERARDALYLHASQSEAARLAERQQAAALRAWESWDSGPPGPAIRWSADFVEMVLKSSFWHHDGFVDPPENTYHLRRREG